MVWFVLPRVALLKNRDEFVLLTFTFWVGHTSKHTPYRAFLSKLGKGRQPYMCVLVTGIPRLARSAWAQNIANMASLYKHMGDILEGGVSH